MRYILPWLGKTQYSNYLSQSGFSVPTHLTQRLVNHSLSCASNSVVFSHFILFDDI